MLSKIGPLGITDKIQNTNVDVNFERSLISIYTLLHTHTQTVTTKYTQNSNLIYGGFKIYMKRNVYYNVTYFSLMIYCVKKSFVYDDS